MQYGYLSEHHSTGENAQKAGDYAQDMAMEMLATTLGLPNDPKSYLEPKRRTMETFWKDLQNPKYHAICTRKQRWLVDNCNKRSNSNFVDII